MQFIDLTDIDFGFNCEYSQDACKYWDYDFSIVYNDEKLLKNLSRHEIHNLRNNCKRILQVTDGI